MGDGGAITGTIFDIQRGALQDGPGVRTTVFLKGCPLDCRWCHNPESIAPEPVLAYDRARCTLCSACVEACPNGAPRVEAAGIRIDRARCTQCGRCIAQCPEEALAVVGRVATVAEVLASVRADRDYYAASGGGVTLSGGEPMAQADFAEAILRAARAEGIHTGLDTSGLAPTERLARIAPWVDLFLYDVKAVDPARHRACTGVDSRPILDNLRMLHDQGARLRLRCPLAPGLNDGPADLSLLAELIRSLPRVEGVEIMPFHPLGRGKAARVGRRDPLGTLAAPDESTRQRWLDSLAPHSPVPIHMV